MTDAQNQISGTYRSSQSSLARVAQDASNVFATASVAFQLVDAAGAVGLPEDAPLEVISTAAAEVTADFSAGLELAGCALKNTANCTTFNKTLDLATLITSIFLGPANLIPADVRRLQDLVGLENWIRSHPISTAAGASTLCGGA